MLAPDCPQKKLVDFIAPLLHEGKIFEAAKEVSLFVQQQTGLAPKYGTKQEALETVKLIYMWCLNNGGREDAAYLLWPRTLFDPRPESTQRIWKALDTQDFILLMGAGSMSKSFSAAVWFFLEWSRDPEFTTVKVLGPSEQHLEDNLFTHLVSLHRSASIPMPGTINSLFIGLDSKARKGSIRGVVIPLGKKAAGRLQGTKRSPRPKPSPIFGPLTRMFVFLDEIANIPQGIWRDIDNLLSNTQGDHGLKIVGAFNPTDQNDPVGVRCEPLFGWEKFDMDNHFEWKSKRGWYVVRLDAKYSENVREGRVIYPGLQTLEGFNAIITNSGGTDSPGYYAMARGCFPPLGTVMAIMPQGLLMTFKAEPIWYEKPTVCGGVDIALQGGDAAIFAKGLYGLATGIKLPASLTHPNGTEIIFKNKRNIVMPRPLLVLENMFKFPKGDTLAMATAIIDLARKAGVNPEWLAIDRTGNGQGVYDMVKNLWHVGVIGINFYEAASKTKIMAEDSGTAEELFDRIQSELLFGLRKWIEFGYLRCMPGVDTTDLYTQMTGRLYRSIGKKSKAEAKDDYKSRNGGKSPDEADAVSLLVLAARRGSGLIPGMDPSNTEGGDEGGDGWEDDGWENGCKVDVTNRFENL